MKKWIYRLLMVVCLAVFGYSAFQLYTIYQQDQQVKTETTHFQKLAVKQEPKSQKQYLEIDWDALREQNPDIIAWLYVPGTPISFPVVQTSNNSYYLNHTAQKEANPRGAIFMDAGAKADLTDSNTIVYGHSVQGGGMFTDLEDFGKQSFFDAHPIFYYVTPQQAYRVNIRTLGKVSDGSVFYTTQFGSYGQQVLDEMKAKATFFRDVDLSTGNLLSLSTCNLDFGFDSDQRYILTGVLQPYNERIEVDA